MGALEGWEERLFAVVTEWSERTFAWGESDCLGLCIAARAAVTGKRLDLPGYTTEAGAVRQLRKLGFERIEDFVDAHLDPVAVAAARRGDWVMRAQPGGIAGAFGVVLGRRAAFMGEAGLVHLPVLDCARAWRVA